MNLQRVESAQRRKAVLAGKGITQLALADQTGIDYWRVHRILNGVIRPRDEEAGAIARALDETVETLFGAVA